MILYISTPFAGNNGNIKENLNRAQRAVADLEAKGFRVICPASQWHFRLGRIWKEHKRDYKQAVESANIVVILSHGFGTVQTALDMTNAWTAYKPVVYAEWDRTVEEVRNFLERHGVKYDKAFQPMP